MHVTCLPCIHSIYVAPDLDTYLVVCMAVLHMGLGACVCQVNAQPLSCISRLHSSPQLKVLKVNVGINEENLENGLKGQPAEILQNVKLRSSKLNLSDRSANTDLSQNHLAMVMGSLKALYISPETKICPGKHA